MFQLAKTQNRMTDEIVRQIEQKILLGDLKPSTMLPPENQMVKEFGVSRNTVREALRMLEASGMVKIKQGSRGGAMVSQFTGEVVTDLLVKAVRLGGISGDQICEFRLAIEPYIAQALAERKNVNPEILAMAERAIAEAEEINGIGGISGYRDMEFHVLLAMATENPMFIIIIKTLKLSMDIITTHAVKPERQTAQRRTNSYHRKILEAIKKGDVSTAREQMRRHLLHVRKVAGTEIISI